MMEPLAGWSVGVTADRRANEQIAMLQRRGATVQLGPVIRTLPLGAEAGLRAATASLIADPPDVLVATTGIGVRSWFASAWTWGLGDALTDALAGREIVARGPKAAAALVGEGVEVAWRAPDETLADVLDHLMTSRLAGRRVAVQAPGRRQPWFTDALVSAGASVIELQVYEWVLPEDPLPARRLSAAVMAGDLDAVTFTSAHAVTNLFELAGTDADRLRAALGNVTVACVGPVTAWAAEAAGAVDPVVAVPSRLGAMIRALTERMAARAVHRRLGDTAVVIQGATLSVGERQVRLTRRERTLLEILLDSDGSVLSKRRLSQLAWDDGVDEHTVEVAVNRLRRKLGPAAPALETANRRGYRLVAQSA